MPTFSTAKSVSSEVESPSFSGDALVPNDLIDQPPQAVYYPAFNGLRGIAVLMVFLCHYAYLVWPIGFFFWGFTGVDLFFVLSGFLITGILFRTRDSAQFFRTFYWRRTMRIFPLYYAFWLAVFATAWLTHPIWKWQTLTFLAYLGNWFPIDTANPAYSIFLRGGHGYTSINIAHFWTLCVEEQFYLTWPLIVWLCRGRGRELLMTIAAVGSVAVLALRIYLQLHLSPQMLEHNLIYGSTYSRVDTLLIGSFLNLWLTRQPVYPRRIRAIAAWLIAAPLLVFVLSMETLGRRWPLSATHPLLVTYGFTLIALICCGIVLLAVEDRMAWTRLLRFKPLVQLGTVSYGFYLLHDLGAYTWSKWLVQLRTHGLGWVMPLTAFAVTYVAARLSYRFVETPFLRMKSWADSKGT